MKERLNDDNVNYINALKKAHDIRRRKKSLHDRTVNNLETRLKNTLDIEGNPMYDKIEKEIEFIRPYKEYQIAGEIDLYATRMGCNGRKYLYLFEIKSWNNPKNKGKAHLQLDREENIIGQYNERVLKFFVTPKKIEWYRKNKT